MGSAPRALVVLAFPSLSCPRGSRFAQDPVVAFELQRMVRVGVVTLLQPAQLPAWAPLPGLHVRVTSRHRMGRTSPSPRSPLHPLRSWLCRGNRLAAPSQGEGPLPAMSVQGCTCAVNSEGVLLEVCSVWTGLPCPI